MIILYLGEGGVGLKTHMRLESDFSLVKFFIVLRMICSALNTIELYISGSLGLKILVFAELGSAMLKAMAHLNQSCSYCTIQLQYPCHIVMESNLLTSLYLPYFWLTILCWDCNEGWTIQYLIIILWFHCEPCSHRTVLLHWQYPCHILIDSHYKNNILSSWKHHINLAACI